MFSNKAVNAVLEIQQDERHFTDILHGFTAGEVLDVADVMDAEGMDECAGKVRSFAKLLTPTSAGTPQA